MNGPNITPVEHPEELTCAFCGEYEGRKAMIENQHEGVGSLICESCVNSLDAWFTNEHGL